MKCRSCGTEIAANALICYRCGTATTEAKFAPPKPRRGRTRAWVTGLILLGLAAAAAVREVGCGSLL